MDESNTTYARTTSGAQPLLTAVATLLGVPKASKPPRFHVAAVRR